MRRRLAILCGCILAAGTVGLYALGEQAVSDDERAVRDLVARYVDARQRRDAQAVGALFIDEADQLTSGGEWRRGRSQIETGTAESSARNPGERTIDLETVRFLAPGVAIADGRYRIDGGGTPPPQMWTTFVVVRTSAAWRIAAIRNMRSASASPR